MVTVISCLMAAALLMVSCTSATQDESTKITLLQGSEPPNFDFIAMVTEVMNTTVCNIYEPLVGRDVNMDPVPKLAVEWEQTAPDRWRFKLREGVKFHDGTPFNAVPKSVIALDHPSLGAPRARRWPLTDRSHRGCAW